MFPCPRRFTLENSIPHGVNLLQDHKHGPPATTGASQQPAAGAPRAAVRTPRAAAGSPRKPAVHAPYPHSWQPPAGTTRQAAALAAGRKGPGAETQSEPVPARCAALF